MKSLHVWYRIDLFLIYIVANNVNNSRQSMDNQPDNKIFFKWMCIVTSISIHAVKPQFDTIDASYTQILIKRKQHPHTFVYTRARVHSVPHTRERELQSSLPSLSTNCQHYKSASESFLINSHVSWFLHFVFLTSRLNSIELVTVRFW